jgi:hypothetical protein
MPLSRFDAEGMTTNERLFVSGLMDEFDEAVSRGDKVTVRKILERVYIDEESISLILKSLGTS